MQSGGFILEAGPVDEESLSSRVTNDGAMALRLSPHPEQLSRLREIRPAVSGHG